MEKSNTWVWFQVLQYVYPLDQLLVLSLWTSIFSFSTVRIITSTSEVVLITKWEHIHENTSYIAKYLVDHRNELDLFYNVLAVDSALCANLTHVGDLKPSTSPGELVNTQSARPLLRNAFLAKSQVRRPHFKKHWFKSKTLGQKCEIEPPLFWRYPRGMRQFPGQGSNTCHSSDPSHISTTQDP